MNDAEFYKDMYRRECLETASLREALITVSASLAAAVSLLERTPKAKKAAPSDKMFDQMVLDYKKSLEAAKSLNN